MSYKYCYACRVSLKNINSIDNDNCEIKLCEDCKNEKYLLINKTSAKKKFCLNDDDLINLAKNTVVNKYGKKTLLYYYDDIVNKAHKKYGGISGLIKVQEKRLKRTNEFDINCNVKLEDKYNMIQCRRNLIFSLLESNNIKYTDNIGEYYNYIEQGDESGYNIDDIIKIFKEFEFLNEKTDYQDIYIKLKNSLPHNYYDTEYHKKKARDIALFNYFKNNKQIDLVPISLMENYKDYVF